MTAKPDYAALAQECEQYAAWNSPPWFADTFGRLAAALREAGAEIARLNKLSARELRVFMEANARLERNVLDLLPDAERYRWIRCADLSALMPLIETYAGEWFDAAVDTARKQP